MNARLCARALAASFLLSAVSSTSSAEQASTCVGCHEKEESDELSGPVEKWRGSVHAAAEVSCDGCHGGNPFEEDAELSMDEESAGYVGSPGWQDVPQFCGSCHEGIHDSYAQGALGKRMQSGERVSVCSTCHDAHAVQPPVPREILTEERCGKCADFLSLVGPMEDGFRDADAALARIRGTLDCSVVEADFEALRDEAILRVHTYDRPRVEEMAARAAAGLAQISARTRELEAESGFRRVLGAGVTGFLLLAWLVADRSAASLKKRRAQE